MVIVRMGDKSGTSKTSGILFDLRGLLGLGGGRLLSAIFLLCNVPIQSEDGQLWQRAFTLHCVTEGLHFKHIHGLHLSHLQENSVVPELTLALPP